MEGREVTIYGIPVKLSTSGSVEESVLEYEEDVIGWSRCTRCYEWVVTSPTHWCADCFDWTMSGILRDYREVFDRLAKT